VHFYASGCNFGVALICTRCKTRRICCATRPIDDALVCLKIANFLYGSVNVLYIEQDVFLCRLSFVETGGAPASFSPRVTTSFKGQRFWRVMRDLFFLATCAIKACL
jgi:hypothetical protein